MPVNFNFVTTDATVQRYLDPTERGQVTHWQQQTGDWTFEFHEGHTAGYPLYVRAANETSGENLPKMITEGKTANDYNKLINLANGGKLVNKSWNGRLEAKAQKDLLNVIANSWPQLQTLARRYWTNSPVVVPPAPAPVLAAAAQFKSCTTNGCAGQVPVVASGKAPCDTCYRFQ